MVSFGPNFRAMGLGKVLGQKLERDKAPDSVLLQIQKDGADNYGCFDSLRSYQL